jgi:hypothetical protein
VTGPAAVRAPVAAVVTSRRPGLGITTAAALLVAVVVASLWVAASVATDLDLGPLAIVVGATAGLVVRRSARAGGAGAAIAAVLVALVAIAVGIICAALAVYSASEGVTLLNALGRLNSASLPHVADEIGVLGAALGGAGVVLAPLLTLHWDRKPPV